MSQACYQDYGADCEVDKIRMKLLKIVNIYLPYFIILGFIYSASASICFSNANPMIENDMPPLSLAGVVVSRNANSSVAVLKNEESGKTVIMKVGDSILDMELTHVFQDGIILKKGEKICWLLLEKTLPSKAERNIERNLRRIDKSDYEVDPSKSVLRNKSLPEEEFVRSEVLERIEKERVLIINETRVVPNYVDGKIDGFKVLSLPKKGIASEVGIQKDDVIKEINGIKLNDLSALVMLYSKIFEEERYEVLVERDKKLVRQVYILK
jgi:general secretion pathway protein C